MTDTHKLCYDRILPKDLAKPLRVLRPFGAAGPAHALLPDIRKLWINGSTLRVRFFGGTEPQRKKVREQATWWTDHANLQFAFTDAMDADIRISFDSADGAWSYIGTDAKSIARNHATMNLGFLDGGTAAHEFGHALGLGHEHQNPDNGMEWNEDVVIRDLGGPPNFWTPEEVRHNVLEKYSVNQFLHGTKFDPESVMLYAFPGTWTKSGQGTELNDALSAQDQQFISSAKVYPKKSIVPVTLQVNAAPTKGKIGEPGEEDLYQFIAARSGPYIVETGGRIDVVMKLFGPDSQTALIAEDDDSGVGLNSKIATELSPGQYVVQIRHFNKALGTGPYSIGVKFGN
jgi:hypothetical protein